MKEFNLPKTSNRVLVDHFYKEYYDLLDKITNLKQELPKAILNEVNTSIKESMIASCKEIIDMSNNHKDMLNKSSTEVVEYIKDELNNNTLIVANKINDKFTYLFIFGIFCSFIGAIFSAIIIKFLL